MFYKGIKQQWKLNNNNNRTRDVFIWESNNSRKLNNNNKRAHEIFKCESNNSEN